MTATKPAADNKAAAQPAAPEAVVTGLEKLRQPVPDNLIAKKPQPTFKDAWDNQPKQRCNICGGYHPSSNTIHLDYVGHAATTDAFLDADPEWNWEPMAVDDNGLPLFDRDGGLWIKLTICGVTRIGYGDSGGKRGPNAVKEAIGDALRNSGMRFGWALELWHKGDLHDATTQDDGREHEYAAGAPSPEERRLRADANDALRDMKKRTDPLGWTKERLMHRFFGDCQKGLITTRDGVQNLMDTLDTDALRAFTDRLVEEGQAAPATEPTTTSEVKMITQGQITFLVRELTRVLGTADREEHLNWCSMSLDANVDSRKHLTADQYRLLYNTLKKLPTAEKKESDGGDNDQAGQAAQR